MARIRTIKPEFWQDYQLAQRFTRDQRLFYIALWNEADDEGRFQAHPVRLKGSIFPYDNDVHGAFIEGSLRALALAGKLLLYEVNGEPYAQLTNFSTHQKINRPSKSRIPNPPKDLPDPKTIFSEDSVNAHGGLSECSLTEGKGREMEEEPPLVPPTKPPRKKKKALPDSWEPTEQHSRLAEEEGVNLDREMKKFRDHASANGRTQLDWDSAFRNWLRKAAELGGNGSRPNRPSNAPDMYKPW